MYKLIFFVPACALEKVKKALFKIGAGKSKKYAACCWETLGTFQYVPLKSSNPQQGKKGKLTSSAEYKVEMICDHLLIDKAVNKLIEVHPYEEPAFEIHKIYKSAKDIK